MKVKIENWMGHEIRFVERSSGEWWAVAKDVTKALDIKNTSMAVNGNPKTGNKGLRDSEKHIMKHYTNRGDRETLVINEPGIYRLIFRSNKPEAEDFQDWVFDTLKTLRQSTGLEGFQVFRMLDKEHQKDAMRKLQESLREDGKVNYIKANTVADKAVSSKYGYKKMLKKSQMTPEMLVDRQPILEDTVSLMGVVNKFELDISVSKTIYGKHIEQPYLRYGRN